LNNPKLIDADDSYYSLWIDLAYLLNEKNQTDKDAFRERIV